MSHRELGQLTVAITGGARGIGAAAARQLRDAGARVVISDRDETLLGRTADELGVLGHPLDVTDPEQWEAFASTVGRIDVLVNNAGIMPVGLFTEERPGVTEQVFAINTMGPIHGTRTFAPRMIAQGGGHIVNIASAVGRVALPGGATYSASKHAVVGFTEAVREELAPYGVDVSMVLPVIVQTDLSRGVSSTRGVPETKPEDVADVIVDVIRRPVAEAWAPCWGQPVAKVSSILPRRMKDLASRAFKADSVLTGADANVRAAYEADVRGR
ncbi:SDR family NAD(P)-dependent oxidoreductase [Nocardioides daphniae]|uniref:SDR family NAD(P)-dependent oxidoreductase n=1 Tax=Nocardioides daphniae TaxID=402297 RepID=A0A4P7U9N8_9ACTN|nr:SDR family NAD(P)-dependent oxidoreductase [Nocardioides daphniae]QCC76311.1 SDR family NAD(P)-dependent oxidoreductase [Nocardioides daphniae]GGD08065.1 short-chain dehydrogenase [Nocardioides daphniae]